MTKRFWSEDYTLEYYTEVVDNEKILEDVPNPKKNLTIDELVDLLNEQDQRIEELEKKITKIEEIIDNRLDKNVIPKWQDNGELFIEEKVGYYYALEQLKKKLIREKICFKDINIKDIK